MRENDQWYIQRKNVRAFKSFELWIIKIRMFESFQKISKTFWTLCNVLKAFSFNNFHQNEWTFEKLSKAQEKRNYYRVVKSFLLHKNVLIKIRTYFWKISTGFNDSDVQNFKLSKVSSLNFGKIKMVKFKILKY